MFLNPHTVTGRIALTLGVLLLMVGACEMPTSSEVEVGKKFVFVYDPMDGGASGLDPSEDSHALVELLRGVGNVEELSVSISKTLAGPVQMDLLAWGTNIVTEDVVDVVHQRFAAQPDLSVEVSELSGTLREKLRNRIGRNLFHLEIRGETAEEIRAEILARLAEQGVEGQVKVDVQVDGNQKMIRVELNDETQDTAEDSTAARNVPEQHE